MAAMRKSVSWRPPGPLAARPGVKHIVVIIDWGEGCNRGVLRGVRTYACDKRDWVLRHTPTRTPPPVLLGWKPDGVIAHLQENAITKILRRQGVPLVRVLAPHAAFRPLVNIDNRAVGAAVAAEFLKRGFQHFAMVGMPDVPGSGDRLKGYAARLALAGRQPLTYALTAAMEHRRKNTGIIGPQRRLQTWLKGLPQPVGVFVTDDAWAREVAELCDLAGLPIPEGIAIIGVDNDEFICEMAQPALSSVAIPWEKIGFEAAACLDRAMQGAPAPAEAKLVEPGPIITRHSSDVMAVDDPLFAQALRFINQRACGHLHMADVLRAVPVSRRWLERQCRRALGRSPLQEIRRVRIARAQHLLTTTDLPLWKICEHCGVAETKFPALFKRETGLTPNRWRHRALLRRT